MPGTITVWEKDPALVGRFTTAPIPDVAKLPLAFNFPAARPYSNDRNTEDFRYWNAASTLRRAADFWAASSTPPVEWNGMAVLDVYLDRGVALQSKYDGQSLSFYHGSPVGHPEVVVYSGESPDLLCHELGHAILDALRPDLFDRGFLETDAFHESFGDMSAILCAMQLPTFCAAVLQETAGQNFWSDSSLSRVAQQFGAALRMEDPKQADADCLRNAWNDHLYEDPAGLNNTGPATEVAANPHSFSRVFTGAFFEILAGMLAIRVGNKAAKPEDLQQVSCDMRDILVEALGNAPFGEHFYETIAAAMVTTSLGPGSGRGPAVQTLFETVFVRRKIIAPAIV
ncbi:hypothetical protein FZ934_22125 (plasmid) [Rhizobium grahamii]|uniref:Peptidase M4 domain-containing protein n=1 Tax=Rhizobium grahamii TaxID=1120045 RepID=A0A5Q0CEV9_9HYPH|nr:MULTISPECIES: hypothetical protein [Rhizobium]QFY63024.1 hypothetical protein FZ934_22125 [Rhizobium grahamii]QRM52220.1 hypothetical protein F3Y33_23530 [Rhizobium sp. BG6]